MPTSSSRVDRPESTSKGIGNDLIRPLYGQTSINGFYFGDRSPKVAPGTVFDQGALKVDVKSTIDFAYLGSEAGNKNQFQIFTGGVWTTLATTPSLYGKNADVAGNPGSTLISSFPAGAFVVPEAIGSSYTVDAGEVIPFRFLINGGKGVTTKFAPNAGADSGGFLHVLQHPRHLPG